MPSVLQLLTFLICSLGGIANAQTVTERYTTTYTVTAVVTSTVVDTTPFQYINFFPVENSGPISWFQSRFLSGSPPPSDAVTSTLNNDANVARTPNGYTSIKFTRAIVSEWSAQLRPLPAGKTWELSFYASTYAGGNTNARCTLLAAIFSNTNDPPVVITNTISLTASYQKIALNLPSSGDFQYLSLQMNCNAAGYVNIDDWSIYTPEGRRR